MHKFFLMLFILLLIIYLLPNYILDILLYNKNIIYKNIPNNIFTLSFDDLLKHPFLVITDD